MNELFDRTYYISRRLRLTPEDSYTALCHVTEGGAPTRCSASNVRLDIGPPVPLQRPCVSSPVARAAGTLRPRGRAPVRVSLEVSPWSSTETELGLSPAGLSHRWWTPGRAERYFAAGHEALSTLTRRLDDVGSLPLRDRRRAS